MNKLLLIVLTLLVSACTTFQDARDRPWDPKPGHALFEQIPAWDRAADLQCCSQLSLKEYMKNLCATDRPIAPRTNRC